MERHDDARLRLSNLGTRDLGDARIVRHVVDELSLVVAHDPTTHALVDRHAEVLVDLGVGVARVDAHELPRLLVEQPDVHGIEVDHGLEPRGDLAEHGGLVQRAQQRGAQVEELMAQEELPFELRRRGLELFVVARVLDGDRRQVGEELGRLQLVLGERPLAHAFLITRGEDAPAMMLACASRSVPGTSAPRGSDSMSFTSWAWL